MPFWITLLIVVLIVQGCAALRPAATTMTERLDAFPREGLPVERPVTIRWNRFQVPFVEAETDRDLAFAMGMVHGHLRLAEIRVLKQLVQGRASEMVGPVARNIDHALRIMDIGRAAPEMVRRLPENERMLLESFTAGLNLYQSRLTELPPCRLAHQRECFRHRRSAESGRSQPRAHVAQQSLKSRLRQRTYGVVVRVDRGEKAAMSTGIAGERQLRQRRPQRRAALSSRLGIAFRIKSGDGSRRG